VSALGRMASDRETLALRAAGLNVWQILPPVVAVALMVSVASLVLSMTARPWGHAEIERTLFEIAKTRASAALRPRFFNTDFERMVVYVDHIEPSGDLVGVLLSDERSGGDRSTVFAHTGRVGGHEDSGRLYLQLLDGTSVSSRESYADYDVTKFRSLEVSLELRTATGDRPATDEPAAMGWSELRSELAGDDDARAREASIELHRRFSIAAAAISLGLFGAALGFVTSATTRGRSVGVSIAIILAYYAVLMLGVGIARARTMPPFVALWAPNLVLAALAIWSLSRNAKDRPMLRERRTPAVSAGGGRA
jgi:lipopolysaccharide export system permease protein